jgi:hypothetical protein
MNNEKNFVVFKQHLAGFLMMNGCKLKDIAPAHDNETKNVFFFDDTEYVKELVKKYKFNQY